MPNITAEMRDERPPVWDMSQERSFLEFMLNQRVTFLLVFFSLVIAGSLQAKTAIQLRIVFGLGFVASLGFLLPILRAQQKVDHILATLYDDPTHPSKIIDDLARSTPLFWRVRLGSMRRWIGYGVPPCLTLSLFALFLLAIGSPQKWLPPDPGPRLERLTDSVLVLRTRLEEREARLLAAEQAIAIVQRTVDSLARSRRRSR